MASQAPVPKSKMQKLKNGVAKVGRVFGNKPKDSQAYPEDTEIDGALTEEELALRDVFNKFDTNGDGVIDKEELSVLLQNFLKLSKPPTQVQLGKIFNKVDLNNDGVIQFYEFKKMMQDRNKEKNQYKTVFNNFDKDGDGFITKDELFNALREVDPDIKEEEVETIIRLADKDKDGRINFTEFIDFFV